MRGLLRGCLDFPDFWGFSSFSSFFWPTEGKGKGEAEEKIPAFLGGEGMYEVAGRGCLFRDKSQGSLFSFLFFFFRGEMLWDGILFSEMKLLETRFSYPFFFLLLLL